MAKLKRIEDDNRPRWDLYRKGVSPSFLNDFMRCRETTRLAWVCGWRASKIKVAPSYGTLGHAYLSRLHEDKELGIWSSKELPTSRDIEERYTKSVIEEFKKQNKILTETYDDDLMLMTAQHEIVIPHYCRYFKKDFAKDTHWIQNEERFRVPFFYSDGKETFLTGFKDAVFKDKNGMGIEETKHKARIDANQETLLPFDTQVMLYAYCLVKMHKIKSCRVNYNIIRRPGLKFQKNDTLEAFTRRLEKDVEKRPDHYFNRLVLEVSEKDLLEWEKKFLIPIMEDVRWWWNEGAVEERSYVNPNELVGKYGTSDYFDLIVHRNYGSYFRKEALDAESDQAIRKRVKVVKKKAVRKKRN